MTLMPKTCPVRLFSVTRQEHPADGGDLAFVPREHPVNGCGQHPVDVPDSF